MTATCAHRTAGVDVKRSSLDRDGWMPRVGGLAAIRFERDRTRRSDRKDRGEVVRGRSSFGDPGLAHAFENARFFILVADVHRRLAPIETSLE